MSTGSTAPVLLTGMPRSGTTWVGRVLTADPSVFEVYEPFNPENRRRLLLGRPAGHLAQTPLSSSPTTFGGRWNACWPNGWSLLGAPTFVSRDGFFAIWARFRGS